VQVVVAPPPRIDQRFVGFDDPVEVHDGRLVARIDVRMELPASRRYARLTSTAVARRSIPRMA